MEIHGESYVLLHTAFTRSYMELRQNQWPSNNVKLRFFKATAGYGHYHTQATHLQQSHMHMERGAEEARTICPI